QTGYLMAGTVRGLQPPRWQNPVHILDVGHHFLAAEMRRSVLYQFVVAGPDDLRWLPAAGESRLAATLRARGEDSDIGGLVVQFALTNMAAPTDPDTPGHWDVRGTIAPWRPAELRSYPAGRLLTPRQARRGGRPVPLHNLSVDVTPEWAVLNM